MERLAQRLVLVDSKRLRETRVARTRDFPGPVPFHRGPGLGASGRLRVAAVRRFTQRAGQGRLRAALHASDQLRNVRSGLSKACDARVKGLARHRAAALTEVIAREAGEGRAL